MSDNLEFKIGNFYFLKFSSKEEQIIFISNKETIEILQLINDIPFLLYKQNFSLEYLKVQQELNRIQIANSEQVNMFKELRSQFGIELKTYQEEMFETF